ncbi:alpha/beta hydrolase family protein [Agrococcus carbonis]|uniref:Alpha/beta hydrolase family protein n=1 Tax=Agrococcus carbonis TaxID=684552 RepID=A0A1H1KZ85_9MICO|nr:alpha/beta fold hydrolase [Agrococcus carbonis]SDR67437.1 Alpha/beta hydrolase family protein [Agrococcus carbonis]
MTTGTRRAAAGTRAGRWALVAGGAVVAGAALAVTGASAALGSMLVTPPRKQVDDIVVLGLDERGVRLGRTPDTGLPGTYALWIGERLAVLGEVVAEDARSVTRAVDARSRAMLEGVASARWSGYALFKPRQVTDRVERVDVPTEVGPAPAWIMGEQDASTWCVQVHGRGVTRRETIRAAPIYLERGIPVMAVSYRNDTEAPPSRQGKYRLGLDEWRDVEAAIDIAVERGARRIVLQGWSMGGQIALQVARRSRHRRRIAGIVLDSPVVGWRPTLQLQVALVRMPVWLVDTAVGLLESPAAALSGTRSLDFDELDNVLHADALSQPILLLHSADDGYVPPDASRALAAARPDLVDYREWERARHTKLWNLDRERYEREIGEWLDARGIGFASMSAPS